MKKICFIVSSITDNGVTRVLSLLLNNIDLEKYNVNLININKNTLDINYSDRINTIKLDNSRDKSDILNKIKRICRLRKELKNNDYDEIIVLGDYAAIYAIIASFFLKIRIIVSERNDPNKEPQGNFKRKIRNLLFKRVDTLVCQTKDASKYYDSIVENRVVIYNPLKDDLPIGGNKRIKKIVNFCRLDAQKNLFLLIDGFIEFNNSRDYILEIYGDGPLKEELINYIAEKQQTNNIFVLPFNRDIHNIIKNYTMFISTSNYEGMSNSMIESMAIGLPCICTDCPIGGTKEVMENNKNGIIIPCNDKKSLILAMNKIVNDKDFSNYISNNARTIREKLNANKICQEWWKII